MTPCQHGSGSTLVDVRLAVFAKLPDHGNVDLSSITTSGTHFIKILIKVFCQEIFKRISNLATILFQHHSVTSEVMPASWRDHFEYAPKQWETTLQCNVVPHWLATYTDWSLQLKHLPQLLLVCCPLACCAAACWFCPWIDLIISLCAELYCTATEMPTTLTVSQQVITTSRANTTRITWNSICHVKIWEFHQQN